MKAKLIFAALALMVASCSNEELTETVQQNPPHIITLTASLPSADPQTRTTLAKDGEGIVMKWENTDKLYLNFKYGANFYRADAPIVPASISADKRQASFMVTVPTEIPAGATFDLYGVYQKASNWDLGDGGYFEKDENNNVYVCEMNEESNITLDKMGTTDKGIARPVLTFAQTGITAAAIAPIVFEHRGWMMALHFKNATGAEMELPSKLYFQYETKSPSSFIYNGARYYNPVEIDLSSGIVSSNGYHWTSKASVYFRNDFNWLPLFGQKLGAGETIVLYRWLMSTPDIDKMYGAFKLGLDEPKTTDSPNGKYLPAKTVEKGKVYHTYMVWDGTDLKVTDRTGTPMP